MRRAFAAALLLAATLASREARADEIDDFLFAYNAYAEADYRAAVTRFRPLVQPPFTLPASLVESARKYYAASLVFEGQTVLASEVLRDVLLTNPEARLDPLQFSPTVVELFLRTREELAEQLTQRRTELAERRRAEQALRERYDRELREALGTERSVVRVSRALMFLPGGVGHFTAGRPGFGALYLTGELASTVFLIISTSAYAPQFWTYNITNADGIPLTIYATRDDFYLSTSIPRPVAIGVSGGFLGAFLLADLLHANLQYRPEYVQQTPRPLPEWIRSVRFAVAPLSTSGQGLSLFLGGRF